MSLLFFPRGLDEIAFGPVWSLVRVPPIANLCPPETPIYTQLKIRFTIYVHLKVPHDTPLCVVFNPWFSMVCNCEFHRPRSRLLTFLVFDLFGA
jgi:hypothetical protein